MLAGTQALTLEAQANAAGCDGGDQHLEGAQLAQELRAGCRLFTQLGSTVRGDAGPPGLVCSALSVFQDVRQLPDVWVPGLTLRVKVRLLGCSQCLRTHSCM